MSARTESIGFELEGIPVLNPPDCAEGDSEPLSLFLPGPMGPHGDDTAGCGCTLCSSPAQALLMEKPTQVSLGGIWLSIVLVMLTNLLKIIFSAVLTWSQTDHITFPHPYNQSGKSESGL